jgi:hypothetical protein
VCPAVGMSRAGDVHASIMRDGDADAAATERGSPVCLRQWSRRARTCEESRRTLSRSTFPTRSLSCGSSSCPSSSSCCSRSSTGARRWGSSSS